MPTITLSNLPAGHFCTYVHHELHQERYRELHDHNFHELFWVEASEGVHWINGRQIPLRSGDLVLIRSDDTHGFGTGQPDGSLRIVNFAFFADIWNHVRRRYLGGEPVFFSDRSLAARTYRLDEYQLASIRQAASLLRSGLRDRLQTESFLLNVLALLKADRFNSGSRAAPSWIRESCSAMALRENFAGGIPALTRVAGRSPEHIAREFRRHLHRTPTEIINDARMAYAADKLSTSDSQIVDIALDCGLENIGHFYRLFQARHGCTPRAYRLRQRAVIYPQVRSRRTATRD